MILMRLQYADGLLTFTLRSLNITRIALHTERPDGRADILAQMYISYVWCSKHLNSEVVLTVEPGDNDRSRKGRI